MEVLALTVIVLTVLASVNMPIAKIVIFASAKVVLEGAVDLDETLIVRVSSYLFSTRGHRVKSCQPMHFC